MEIEIKISCDTIKELINHFDMLKEQVKQKAKKLKIDEDGWGLPVACTITIDGCAGSHELTVIEE